MKKIIFLSFEWVYKGYNPCTRILQQHVVALIISVTTFIVSLQTFRKGLLLFELHFILYRIDPILALSIWLLNFATRSTPFYYDHTNCFKEFTIDSIMFYCLVLSHWILCTFMLKWNANLLLLAMIIQTFRIILQKLQFSYYFTVWSQLFLIQLNPKLLERLQKMF